MSTTFIKFRSAADELQIVDCNKILKLRADVAKVKCFVTLQDGSEIECKPTLQSMLAGIKVALPAMFQAVPIAVDTAADSNSEDAFRGT